METEVQKNIDTWLTGSYDQKTKDAIQQLLITNPQEAISAFYTTMSFGTGGMRGLMGIGTNRMNIYTIAQATQGLANYLKKQPEGTNKRSVFIGYDSRHHSKEFAEEAAKVLAGNGIYVYLCPDIRPTPFVSFGCRFHHCSSAIMITASHNPPEYNGYKVYGSDGGQVLPPHDTGIIQEVNHVKTIEMVTKVNSLDHPLIEYVDSRVDKAYLKAVQDLQLYPEVNQDFGNRLKIVYTSLHGTGITLMPEALKSWGFTDVSFVEKQCIPDGSFPTTQSPNPEEKAALKLGMDLLEKRNADILIATDPDADRVGVVVNHQGKLTILNGNQIACICLEHICKALSSQGKLPSNAAFIKTIVTTELFKAISDSYNRTTLDVLTGFKYIAQKIGEWEQNRTHEYVFGGEESYGYLLGTYVRDKDAISAAALICETALTAKMEGKTLVDLVYDLYRKHGVYYEKLLPLKFDESKEGKDKMEKSMAALEKIPPSRIAGIGVKKIENYRSSISTDVETGKATPILLPKSDVLAFYLLDGSKLTVRPSGTEPKIKLYCEVVIRDFSNIDAALKAGEEKATRLLDDLKPALNP